MRGLTHRWVVAQQRPHTHPPGTDALPTRVLCARGIVAPDAATAFCEPRLTDLHDPSLLPGVDRAAQRLLDALKAGEPTVLYGDYDVDGVAACAILFHVCRALSPEAPVTTYVPHRLDEGYGVNGEALERFAADGVRLVVTVDCGVTAVAQAALARRLGLDLVISDHHNFAGDPPDLPDAHTLVHPRLPGGSYPFGELCGAAVAFKIAWRLATLANGSDRVPDAMRTLLLDMLALAALGTVADVVPLVGENRVIARFGLARLRSIENEGMRALIEASGLASNNVNAEDVGFKLGPRLNACGRMGHAREAIELLTVARGARAHEIAGMLTQQNDKRRAVERAIALQADAMAVEAGMTTDERRAIVLAHEDWHPGVLGIVCSRLVEKRRRPTILLQRTGGPGGRCVGSGRSIDGVSLHAAIAECEDLLEKYGGHDMAAGLALPESNLAEFVERVTEAINRRTSVEDLTPLLRIDCDATMDELTPDAVHSLGRLGPFGRENPTPVIRVPGVRLEGSPQPLGQQARHLALKGRCNGRVMRFVAWNWGDRREALPAGSVVDLVVEPKVSAWSTMRTGQPTVEPVIRDVRVLEG
ncbi:MAG: single-stranded-DNA-specific exonuclease RecJ [Phycisphaerales bacterium]|nr:MAG: single-stranded-DNA-specific exonuclease RecJ [Phycisphaerales bacterium]